MVLPHAAVDDEVGAPMPTRSVACAVDTVKDSDRRCAMNSATTSPPASSALGPARSLADTGDAELLTLPEVALVLRVPVNTVRWWRQQGSGPEFFKVGRRLVTTAGDLRDWIEQQKRCSEATSGPDVA
jgi:hypothetical protein